VGQTTKSYLEDGVYIGTADSTSLEKMPAMSLQKTLTIDTQSFEGTYTQGSTTIDD
jgi:hypothetical protein